MIWGFLKHSRLQTVAAAAALHLFAMMVAMNLQILSRD
jgi:hypothetical protein